MDQRRVERVDQAVGRRRCRAAADDDAGDDGAEHLEHDAPAADVPGVCVCSTTALVEAEDRHHRADGEERLDHRGEDRAGLIDRAQVGGDGYVHDHGVRPCTSAAIRAGSASAAKRTAAVSKSPPANALASAAHGRAQPAVRRNTRLPSVSEVKRGHRHQERRDAGAGQRDLELVAGSRVEDRASDSGMRAPVAGSSSARPSGASKCCIVVPAGKASSDVAYRRSPCRTNTFADGTPSAAATPSTAVS